MATAPVALSSLSEALREPAAVGLWGHSPDTAHAQRAAATPKVVLLLLLLLLLQTHTRLATSTRRTYRCCVNCLAGSTPTWAQRVAGRVAADRRQAKRGGRARRAALQLDAPRYARAVGWGRDSAVCVSPGQLIAFKNAGGVAKRVY
jgi:hypothetical protein